jgi:tetratricopeptide (TPR) repeat protein
VNLEPNNAFAWRTLARFSIDYNSDIRGLGLPAARQALLLVPEDPAALDLLGLAFFQLGDTISAERFLQRAIEKDATFAEAYLHLGQLYIQQQESLLARDYLRQALVLAQEKPVGEMARRLLQQYFQEGGQ